MTTTRRLACASGLLVVLSCPALAERADREKPIHLEADRLSIDDVNKVKILEGNAVLTQGTMELRTSRLVITEDADGFQKASAFGGANGLAHFKQKREGVDEITEGEAERIDHDARSDITEFFIRAWIQSGLDEVKGQYIFYDALNEKYLVTTGSGAPKVATGMTQARARAIIQPKNKKEDAVEKKNEPLALKPAAKVSPRVE